MSERRCRFLLTTYEAGGTVGPMLTVAQKLLKRGHHVRVMSDRCNAPEAEAGVIFEPWTRAPSRPDRSPATEIIRDWDVEGVASFRRALDALWAGPALAYAQDVMAALHREPADLVVTSEMLFGVAAGCEAAGQAFTYLTANLSLFPLPGVPPMGSGLEPPKTADDQHRHDELTEALRRAFDQGLPALNAARDALNLHPLAHTLEQTTAARATLLGTARAFDFAPEMLPSSVRYVGPQLGGLMWPAPWQTPFPAGDRRPLILVAFSTTFQNHAGTVQRILDAAATLPVRVVVTLGGSLDASELVPPANARLVPSASHDAVMRDAALVVTHGGHGTVMRSLIHGLPLLVLPHGRDQADNAVRVTERGAGLALVRSAGSVEIRAAMERLLNEAAFRDAARRLGTAVAREAAESPVAAVLEALALEAELHV